MMPCGSSNIIDIVRSDALLSGSGPVEGGVRIPRKYGLNGTIPAIVKSRVGSSGTREKLENLLCPLFSKYVRKSSRSSFPLLHCIIEMSPPFFGDYNIKNCSMNLSVPFCIEKLLP